MSLPPFDGTGWIDGMPGLPGGATGAAFTARITPASPIAADAMMRFEATSPGGTISPEVWSKPAGAADYTLMPDVDGWYLSTTDTKVINNVLPADVGWLPGTTGNLVQFRHGEDVVDLPPYEITAPPAVPLGVLSGPSTAVAGETLTLTFVANEDEAAVFLYQSVDGLPFSAFAPLTRVDARNFTYTSGTLAVIEAISYQVRRDPDDGVFSNTHLVNVTAPGADPNMGWTKAELIAFAADHNPPIDVPNGTKAEILAAILDYIEAHPEEN